MRSDALGRHRFPHLQHKTHGITSVLSDREDHIIQTSSGTWPPLHERIKAPEIPLSDTAIDRVIKTPVPEDRNSTQGERQICACWCRALGDLKRQVTTGHIIHTSKLNNERQTSTPLSHHPTKLCLPGWLVPPEGRRRQQRCSSEEAQRR